MAECLLSLKNVSKSFAGVRALDQVSFDVLSGEVHVLMGENGAGKSTLMKIINGIYRMDAGEVFLCGNKTAVHNPREAQTLGIAMIHQELNNVLEMTVAENIFLGREPKKLGLLDKRRMSREAKRVLEPICLDVDPTTLMKNLSVAQMQMVEIAKAVSLNARIIIMDEPTSAISDKETEALFEIIRLLKERGTGTVYISHKIDEIFRIADRITVLRDGVSVGTYEAHELNREKLITLMVGRAITNVYPPAILHEIGEAVLEVENLSCEPKLHPVSFILRAGEILGVGGLMGAGRSELLETLFGVRKATGGSVRVCGKLLDINSPRDAISAGMAFVTEDRKLSGLNLKTSVRNDISIVTLGEYCKWGQFISHNKENEAVDDIMRALNVKAPSRVSMVSSLSGGNQQKVVLARWLLAQPRIILLDEPTRGIDVGSKYEIYAIIRRLAASGRAVLMVSSEMPEIMGICDRVIVLSEGKLMGELSGDAMNQETMMRLAAGMEGKSYAR